MKECHFCSRPRSELRVRASETEAGVDLHSCDRCWDLLKSPATALPLIRGNLAISLRGKMPGEQARAALDKFMARLAGMKKPG